MGVVGFYTEKPPHKVGLDENKAIEEICGKSTWNCSFSRIAPLRVTFFDKRKKNVCQGECVYQISDWYLFSMCPKGAVQTHIFTRFLERLLASREFWKFPEMFNNQVKKGGIRKSVTWNRDWKGKNGKKSNILQKYRKSTIRQVWLH